MPNIDGLLLSAAFACVALFYSAVGQAGGTGYVAIMGLAGFEPSTIKTTALSLNILVAAIGCVRFYSAGLLTWRSCYPFGVLGAPFSLLGGAVHLPSEIYQPIVGALLLIAAYQMLRTSKGAAQRDQAASTFPPFLPSLLVGGLIGFGSGITGVGGGIFLAPLILMLGWAQTRQTAAIAAAFNLLNSTAALVGAWATTATVPVELPMWLAGVAVGAFIGSWAGAKYLRSETLRILLAVLLLAAGTRMVASPIL